MYEMRCNAQQTTRHQFRLKLQLLPIFESQVYLREWQSEWQNAIKSIRRSNMRKFTMHKCVLAPVEWASMLLQLYLHNSLWFAMATIIIFSVHNFPCFASMHTHRLHAIRSFHVLFCNATAMNININIDLVTDDGSLFAPKTK